MPAGPRGGEEWQGGRGLSQVGAMAGRAELQEGPGVQKARFPAAEHQSGVCSALGLSSLGVGAVAEGGTRCPGVSVKRRHLSLHLPPNSPSEKVIGASPARLALLLSSFS